DIRSAQALFSGAYVAEPVRRYMVDLCEKTRELPQVQAGVSPRGLLALLRACQALALIRGRDFVTPDDVKELAVPVLAHRIVLSGLYGRSEKNEDNVREALSEITAPVESGERT
ncbi:MAG: magnesium chelatase, partial [Clostridia bacterium]|nr:magnesium chelatase [Clostridia bacterium]